MLLICFGKLVVLLLPVYGSRKRALSQLIETFKPNLDVSPDIVVNGDKWLLPEAIHRIPRSSSKAAGVKWAPGDCCLLLTDYKILRQVRVNCSGMRQISKER